MPSAKPYLQVVGCLHFCVHWALEGRGVGWSLLEPLFKFNGQIKKKKENQNKTLQFKHTRLNGMCSNLKL